MPSTLDAPPQTADGTGAILTCGFKGFENHSLWVSPMLTRELDMTPRLFADALEAKIRAESTLAAGCALAAKRHPDLAPELAILAGAQGELGFFELPGHPHAAGWFRLAFDARGSSAQALAACEDALCRCGVPLMAAETEPAADGARSAFAQFVQGDSEQFAPAAIFADSILDASSRVAIEFATRGQDLGSAEAVILETADGTRRLVATMPSAGAPDEALAPMKTYGRFAQACIEARRSKPDTPSNAAFFEQMAQSLGAGPGPMAERVAVSLPSTPPFAAPSSLFATRIGGLPTEGFDELARAFLGSLAKRFGPVAGSSKGLEGDLGAPVALHDWLALAPLFAKLPSQAAGSAPLPASPARAASPPSP